ncbi:MAG: AAA family ATPase [Bacilli bacterium]
MNKIIAVVGMCGVGKSVASEFLEELGYKKVYFGGVTLEKMKEEGIEVTPDNEKKMRESLRAKYGMGAYAIILLPKIRELSKNNNVVLDGLYSWDELKILKQELGNSLTVIAVIADKKIRYDRLKIREVRPLTNEEAKNRDVAEIENIAKAGPIAYADYYIDNNHDIDNYKQRLLDILKEIDKER